MLSLITPKVVFCVFFKKLVFFIFFVFILLIEFGINVYLTGYKKHQSSKKINLTVFNLIKHNDQFRFDKNRFSVRVMYKRN